MQISLLHIGLWGPLAQIKDFLTDFLQISNAQDVLCDKAVHLLLRFPSFNKLNFKDKVDEETEKYIHWPTMVQDILGFWHFHVTWIPDHNK